MTRIRTNRGDLTDEQFEALAAQYFRRGDVTLLPALGHVDRVLRHYGIDLPQRDWARAVAERALAKIVVHELARPLTSRSRGRPRLL